MHRRQSIKSRINKMLDPRVPGLFLRKINLWKQIDKTILRLILILIELSLFLVWNALNSLTHQIFL